MGWRGDVQIQHNALIQMRPCNGNYAWDESFFVPTKSEEPIHGAFYFDPFRSWNTRGLVQPQSIHMNNMSVVKQFYKTMSTWVGGKSYVDYDIWNTSVMSVVVAGNSTLVIGTDTCPVEGCPGVAPTPMGAAFFHWSDTAAWAEMNVSFPCTHPPRRTNDFRMCSHEYPCGCGDVTIYEDWTVILDVSTPFLNTLTIMGTLILQHDATDEINLHANLIDIRGGRLVFGNSTHPFTGPMARLVLHGDMYFHGKECTVPIDTQVSAFGCWKQISVNGDLSVHGKEVPVISRTLSADAWAGATSLVLDGPVSASGGWETGADIIVSSTDAGGIPEYHTILSVSADGRTVHLSDELASSKIGTTSSVVESSGKVTVLDGRATVSLLSRNIEIRGGYDADYDYISGVGPDLTDYGVTIRTREAYSVEVPGWDSTMAGYDLYGVLAFPAGFISGLHWVRFRAAGKQYDLEPAIREPPIVLHSKVPSLMMEGVVVTEPLAGKLFTCTKVDAYQGANYECKHPGTAKTIIDSIFVSTSVEFAPGVGVTDVAERNIFFGGDECRNPSPKLVYFGGSGSLQVHDNSAHGNYAGFVLQANCENYLGWSGNVATGNAVGFAVESGCTNLFLEGYRNSAGIVANTHSISNFLMVENGLAVTPGIFANYPDEKFNLPGDVLSGGSQLGHIFDGTIVGRAPVVEDTVRSANCDKWTRGGDNPSWHKGSGVYGHKIGGTMCKYRWFEEYGYSGFAAQGAYVAKQGTGYGDLKVRTIKHGDNAGGVAAFRYVLDDLRFFGFSGVDTCGRRNVAISNEMAGDGEGTLRPLGAHFGKATCYPVAARNLSFVDTPDFARLRFSTGKSYEAAYGLCTVHDEDGSLLAGSTFVEPGVGSYFLKPVKRHIWPPEVLRDCAAWAATDYSDDYSMGTCLWWLRKYDNLRGAITDASKRGLVEQGLAGTHYPKAFCDEIFTTDGIIDNNVKLCSGMDYVLLKSFIPERIVSGAEVLYGPVGYVNMRDSFFGSSTFAGEDTSVDIYRDYTDPRGDQIPPMTGKETEQFWPVNPRYTQPYLATLVNKGTYRIEYTGDIGLFKDGYLEYGLVGLTDKPEHTDEFGMILDIKFMTAVNLAFYYNGKAVPASPRRSLVTMDAPAGTNYMDPVSKIVSFVLKGTEHKVRFKQLDVVSVGFGVAVTFESFFADNFIDPNSIDSSFAGMVPPTYAASYDPDNGNIVKTNPFVSNLASVLNINPARIRVVNVVPGNRRRLRELASQDPGKWRHILDSARNLDGDEGLGLDFEISSVDPCEDVLCVHGDCGDNGVCICNDGFRGETCNVSFVAVNCSLPGSDCAAPSFEPTPMPTITTTSTHMDPFEELMSVADTLSTSAAAGTLDTGYEITEAIVSLPDDVCGVPGGDGTTCLDACGVANGDESTCADVCGVANGDGTSCLVAEGTFYECTHASATTGIRNERQTVQLRGIGMQGTYALRFNTMTTQFFSIYEASAGIEAAFNALDTIGLATVVATVTTGGGGVSAVDLNIEFKRSTGTFPYHLGAMPLIEVVTSSLTGVTYEDVAQTCAGIGRTGHTYDEQTFTATKASGTASNATFTLELALAGDMAGGTAVSAPIRWDAGVTEVTTALTEGLTFTGLDEDLGFEITSEYLAVFKDTATTATAATWRVRWFFAPASDGLRMTTQGDVPRFAQHNAAGTPLISVAVTASTDGVVPLADMPISAAEMAAEAGAEAEDSAEEGPVETSMAVTEVVHVCGDGARTSIEGCDDLNLESGDGCSMNCTVESGFVCSTRIGVQSSCYVPETPTLYFEHTLYGPVHEGTSATVWVRRMGYNGSAVSAHYQVASSTAFSIAKQNDDCASAGDFDATPGTIDFAAGETRKAIVVPVLRDFIWEQTTFLNEKFVVRLTTATGANIDAARGSTQVSIHDVDPIELLVGWCLTVEPSQAPTPTPTHEPTHAPTSRPTFAPTRAPTLSPTVSLAPTTSPTSLPSLTPVPTPGTFEPTSMPLPRPTRVPTPLPTHAPTPSPTPVPTLAPSVSHHPSPQPTAPSPEPTPEPTPLWIGVEVEAHVEAVIDGFSSVPAFDSDQQLLFRSALAGSVDLVASPDDVDITRVRLTGVRRQRRSLSALSLTVEYTLTMQAEGSGDSAALENQLLAQLTVAFDDAGGTSPMQASIAAQSAALSVPTVAALDSASTLAALPAVTFTVTRLSTARPSAQPTPAPAPRRFSGEHLSALEVIAIAVGCALGGLLVGMAALYAKRRFGVKEAKVLSVETTERSASHDSCSSADSEALAHAYAYQAHIHAATTKKPSSTGSSWDGGQASSFGSQGRPKARPRGRRERGSSSDNAQSGSSMDASDNDVATAYTVHVRRKSSTQHQVSGSSLDGPRSASLDERAARDRFLSNSTDQAVVDFSAQFQAEQAAVADGKGRQAADGKARRQETRDAAAEKRRAAKAAKAAEARARADAEMEAARQALEEHAKAAHPPNHEDEDCPYGGYGSPLDSRLLKALKGAAPGPIAAAHLKAQASAAAAMDAKERVAKEASRREKALRRAGSRDLTRGDSSASLASPRDASRYEEDDLEDGGDEAAAVAAAVSAAAAAHAASHAASARRKAEDLAAIAEAEAEATAAEAAADAEAAAEQRQSARAEDFKGSPAAPKAASRPASLPGSRPASRAASPTQPRPSGGSDRALTAIRPPRRPVPRIESKFAGGIDGGAVGGGGSSMRRVSDISFDHGPGEDAELALEEPGAAGSLSVTAGRRTPKPARGKRSPGGASKAAL